MANPHPTNGFKKGDPRINRKGKLVGTKDKLTLLKEKIIDAALNIDLESKKKFDRISPTDVVKLAAGFVPKEQVAKLEGSLEIRWIE